MLWAAPVLALLALPAAAVLGIDPNSHPQELAYLYGAALLGTWTTLVPNKVLETRRLVGNGRRVVGLVLGLLTGIAAIGLAPLVRLDGFEAHHLVVEKTALGRLESGTNAALFPLYFGLLYGISAGWSSLTARDRKKRFRIMPIVWTGLLATALTPLFWPYDRPYGIAIAAMIATGVQLVSPWNKAASLYARYVRTSEKQKRMGKVVSC
jgi:hypothetical protein